MVDSQGAVSSRECIFIFEHLTLPWTQKLLYLAAMRAQFYP